MPDYEIKSIQMSEIVLDDRTQPRAEEFDEDTMLDYKESIEDGAKFPPIIVFYDGHNYYLADGHYRYAAENKIGCKDTMAEVHKGTLRDAIYYSLGANASHGKARTRADKRKCVDTMLADSEWAKFSDRAIAESCKVSHTFVSAVRKKHVDKLESKSIPEPEPTKTSGNVASNDIRLTTPADEGIVTEKTEKPWSPLPDKKSFDSGKLDSLIDLLNEAYRLAEALEENDIAFDIHGAITIAKRRKGELK